MRRDRDASEWTRIPAARSGPTPDWPLTRPTKRELELWEREWHRPQAVMWEAYGQFLEVAMYVRSLKTAEATKASVAARTLLIRQQDALGLTVAGLRANRWIIAADDRVASADEEERPTRPAPRGGTARHRLGVINGGA